MKTTSFLDIAETRAAHLRELSHHLRSLEWTNASRREVENEIPELELAMAVYRRLNAEGDTLEDMPGAQAFLTVADVRAEHLRRVSHHMHALEWVHASRAEVENEIPELELAMAVYRRLSGDPDAVPARSSSKSHGSPSHSSTPASKPRATAPRPTREEEDDEDGAEDAPAPSFSQFAMAHLDRSADDAPESDTRSNGRS